MGLEKSRVTARRWYVEIPLEAQHVAEYVALLLRLQVGEDEVLAADLFASEAALLQDVG